MTFEQLRSSIQNAGELDFGTVFNNCIELYKKMWLQGVLTILLIALFVLPITFIYGFLLGSIGVTVVNPLEIGDFELNSIFNFYSSDALYNIPVTIISTVFTLVLLAGFYRLCKQKDLGESIPDDYFYFFKSEYFNKIMILSLAYSGITVISQMLCFFPYIYAIVPLMYFSVIFAFNSEKSAEEIIKISFSLGNKKWLISFGTLIVTSIVGALGILACGIGLLFTISLAYLPAYVIYKAVIGFEDNDEIMKIGKE